MSNVDDIRLSKSLSWLLRHGAVKEGLPISSEGYVAVDQILLHRSLRGKCSFSDIQRVVACNSKQRFKLRFNPDSYVLEIKANQGHSISCVGDEGLTPILEPKYQTVVHGTYFKCWPQIKVQGLSRMGRRHIHLAKGTLGDKVTSGLRHDVQIYIFIDLKKAIDEGVKFYESENGVILTAGNEDGFLLPRYFSKVIRIDTGGYLPSFYMISNFWWPPFPLRMEVGRENVQRRAPRAHPSVTYRAQSQGATTRAPGTPTRTQGGRAQAQAAATRAQGTSSTNSPGSPASPVTPPNDGTRVIVSGFPYCTQPQDLVRALAAFGPPPPRVERMAERYAVLRCGTAQLAAQAAAARHVVYGTLLAVKPFTGKLDKPPQRKFTLSKQKEVIVQPQSLTLADEFHNQLDEILARVRLTQQEVMSIATLYSDLERTLGQLWPGCVCTPFGSITTGLGVKTSDADCFVDIPPVYRSPHINYVNKAKRVLEQQPDTFAELLAIPRANTPIVKLHHVPTNTNCDVSFKSVLGARNSRLIAYLLHARPQLLPVAVAVKYWAAVNEVTGAGRLSNYALTLLLIAYLQHKQILPSVASLQRDRTQDYIVDFWNTGFAAQPGLLPPAQSTSIPELLGGFFQHYADFDFDKLVVCPFMGRPLAKEAFKTPLALPPEFELYKRNVMENLTYPLKYETAMVIQDPFEQCHNVAGGVSQRTAADIKEYFKFAAAAYEAEKANECREFLKKILLEKPKIIKKRSNPEYRVNLFTKLIGAAGKDDDWKARVREAVFCIFEKIFKLSLGKVEEKTNPDTKKEREKYLTTMARAVWKRKQFAKIYKLMELPFVEKESRITEEILLVDHNEIALEFQVIVTFKLVSLSATVSVKLCNGDVELFKDFCRFFISNGQSWFSILLKRQGVNNGPDLGSEPENLEAAAADSDDDSEDGVSKKSEDAQVTAIREALVDCLAQPLMLKSEG